MKTRCPRSALILVLILGAGLALGPPPVAAESQMTWAVHVSLAPTWFDPAEHTGIATITMVLYVYQPYSSSYEDLKLRK